MLSNTLHPLRELYRPLPGRLIVAVPPQDLGPIKIPLWVERQIVERDGDAAIGRSAYVLRSGLRDVADTDTVWVFDNAPGLAIGPLDNPRIPDGWEVRIYGVHAPASDAVMGVKIEA